jgi:hypothetical protein
VAFGSAKCKRLGCPELHKWTADQVKVVWGNKVQNISKEQEEYKFCHETFKSGLVIKHLPPASIAIAEVPVDISPFVLATCIFNLSFYSSIRSQNTQDMIKVRHWVKVVVSEPQGDIGHITGDCDGTATVTLCANDIPLFNTSLHALSLKYSYSILLMVDKDCRNMTFIEKDTNEEVYAISLLYCIINIPLQHITHMDTIEPYSPPPTFTISHWEYGSISVVCAIPSDPSVVVISWQLRGLTHS